MRKMLRVTGVFALLMVTDAVQARAEPKQCQAINDALEHQKKAVSYTLAQGTADNSAPRATMRYLDALTFYSVMNINLTLLVQNGCKPPSEPFQVSEYVVPALECVLEQSKGNFKSKECDFKTWKKGTK